MIVTGGCAADRPAAATVLPTAAMLPNSHNSNIGLCGAGDGPGTGARDAGCPKGAIHEPACRSLTINYRKSHGRMTDG